jgi:hypothetical protein
LAFTARPQARISWQWRKLDLGPRRAVRIECGREQLEGKLGGAAYLTVDDDEPAEAMVYCAECVEEEFGDHAPR